MVLQRHDRGDNIECLNPCLETLDLAVNDGFRALGLLLAGSDVGGYGLLQIVDIVDEDGIQLVHPGINVARRSNVGEVHGTVLAAAEKHFAVLASDDGMPRAGGGNGVVAAIASVI